MSNEQIAVIQFGALKIELPPEGVTLCVVQPSQRGVVKRHPAADDVEKLPRIGAEWNGGIYAGIARGDDGQPDYHLILLPGQASDVNWKAAQEWAAQQDGTLPTRREQSLLYANLKDQFAAAWYWSSEQHDDDAYAWCQHFRNGTQSNSPKSAALRAVAVRRFNYSII
ncbi:hypothetical protein FHX57_002011 [Paraburkholderia tropica]|uniref:DUF1566 domain-containing protein n=1 Tax=Paraburkholderia tropica TaxID=92647 RepID=UPI0017DE7E3D|nr:DUF1566 domain-containing protein [Paraburkholderia tropica]MBB2999680.1 hypothetical protein [Paraburkholderia tropica]